MNTMQAKRVARAVAVWVPSILLGLLFVLQGLMKLGPDSPWVGRFEAWGYPAGFLTLVGVVELVAGVGMFVPRVSRFAALALAVVMAGASATHAIHAEGFNAGFTLGLVLVLLGLAWARWPRGVQGGTPAVAGGSRPGG